MEPKKICVGNLFQEKFTREIIEVVSVSGNDITFTGNFPDDWQGLPIALNRQRLLEFGYKLFPWGFVKKGFPLISVNLVPDEKYWIELGNGLKIKLPFVHTLQNMENLISE